MLCVVVGGLGSFPELNEPTNQSFLDLVFSLLLWDVNHSMTECLYEQWRNLCPLIYVLMFLPWYEFLVLLVAGLVENISENNFEPNLSHFLHDSLSLYSAVWSSLVHEDRLAWNYRNNFFISNRTRHHSRCWGVSHEQNQVLVLQKIKQGLGLGCDWNHYFR